jgi:uncharacterized protein YjiS (DUF1127 family)
MSDPNFVPLAVAGRPADAAFHAERPDRPPAASAKSGRRHAHDDTADTTARLPRRGRPMTSRVECADTAAIAQPAPAEPISAPRSPRWSTAVVSALALVLTWIARWRDRRDLAMLDDYMLKDLGLTRCDVFREVEKPIWRP